MRPRIFDYTLAALDADGYVASVNVNSVAVGESYTIRSATTHPGDGCSHPVTIESAGDATGTVFTVTGTDAEGRTISEDMTAADTGITTSTKYYSDVTSVVRKSGATGAVAFTVGYTALARTPIYPIDRFAATGCAVVTDIGGTINYTVQQTSGNVWTTAADSLGWSPIAGISGATADDADVTFAGMTGVRVHVASHTSGTLRVTYAQCKD